MFPFGAGRVSPSEHVSQRDPDMVKSSRVVRAVLRALLHLGEEAVDLLHRHRAFADG